MCLAIPGKVTAVEGLVGEVDVGGARRRVSFALIDEPKIGEYVLVHVGNALAKIDEDEAMKTLSVLDELADAMDQLDEMDRARMERRPS